MQSGRNPFAFRYFGRGKDSYNNTYNPDYGFNYDQGYVTEEDMKRLYGRPQGAQQTPTSGYGSPQITQAPASPSAPQPQQPTTRDQVTNLGVNTAANAGTGYVVHAFDSPAAAVTDYSTASEALGLEPAGGWMTDAGTGQSIYTSPQGAYTRGLGETATTTQAAATPWWAGPLAAAGAQGTRMSNAYVRANANRDQQTVYGYATGANPVSGQDETLRAGMQASEGKEWDRQTVSTLSAQGAAGQGLITYALNQMGLAASPYTGGISMLLPWAYNPVFAEGRGAWGSSKGEEQFRRDALRDRLQDIGLTTQRTPWEGRHWEGHGIRLADGTMYNLGSERTPEGNPIYETPTDNPFAAEIVGLAQPLAAILTGGDEWATPQLTNMLTNAALSNARDYNQAADNIIAFASEVATPDQFLQGLRELAERGAITAEQYRAYRAAISSLFQGNPRQAGEGYFTERLMNRAAARPMIAGETVRGKNPQLTKG